MVEIDSRSKRKKERKKDFPLTTVTFTEVYTLPTHSL